MKPNPYSLTELIQNDEFIAWVLRPKETNEARWKQFLRDFPERKQIVEQAKEYVILLAEDTGRHPPSLEQKAKMWGVVEEYLQTER